jgi:hypothetical protein
MRLLHVPRTPRAPSPRILLAIVAAVLLAALLVLSTVGLEEWFAPLAVGCVVCLLPLAPCVLHQRRH